MDTLFLGHSGSDRDAPRAELLAWYSRDYAGKRYCQWELTAAWLAGEAERQVDTQSMAVQLRFHGQKKEKKSSQRLKVCKKVTKRLPLYDCFAFFVSL
jgi:hypothetical protein